MLRASAMVFLLMLSVTISADENLAKMTVVNNTSHYLHVLIGDESYLYISPDRSVTQESEGHTTFVVKVFYSPGQGVSGSAERSFDVAPYREESSGCTHGANGGWECTTSPASPGLEAWSIAPDSLQQASP
ncbi:MAG: hypothetical protein GTO51_11245 [Candidatus Latescibacteria bacterium]|nr:hypothetical protein [Candidatus Latescibacterota bacterium]NIO30156.1 hypothetical protein [Candidatus Latescibacterota bacterium]NIO57773.1 hypothetical protein [Candidatus Latescibacterota bacterium]NIT03313.1 hypothetical protein [Candidatus Latescibacterota bacterium]